MTISRCTISIISCCPPKPPEARPEGGGRHRPGLPGRCRQEYRLRDLVAQQRFRQFLGTIDLSAELLRVAPGERVSRRGKDLRISFSLSEPTLLGTLPPDRRSSGNWPMRRR